jgi:hypothetical protein
MKTYELKYKLEDKNWIEENKRFNSNISSDVYRENKTGLCFVVNYIGRKIVSVKYSMKREKAQLFSAQWIHDNT